MPPLPEPKPRSPFDTRKDQAPPPPPPVEPEPPTEPEREGSRTKSKTSQSEKRPAGTTDLLLSMPDELSDRMDDVIAWTLPHTGVRSKSEFIRRLIARACAEYEDRYNEGKRFPHVPKPKKR